MEIIFQDHFYWKFPAPNADELIRELRKETEIDNTIFPWGQDCEVDLIRLTWQKYEDYLQPSLNLLDLPHDNVKFSACVPWMNLYKRNGWQDCHDHKDADLACCFFLQDGDEFYFHNRNVNLSRVWNQPDVMRIQAKKGEILFFPAHMLHGVYPNRKDTIRKTLSCNFWFITQ